MYTNHWGFDVRPGSAAGALPVRCGCAAGALLPHTGGQKLVDVIEYRRNSLIFSDFFVSPISRQPETDVWGLILDFDVYA